MSDLVLGIISPHKYGIGNYRGYKVNRLKNRMRNVGIVKNRDGEADKDLGLLFLGENGFFKELPKYDEMTENIYNKIMNLKSNITI